MTEENRKIYRIKGLQKNVMEKTNEKVMEGGSRKAWKGEVVEG